SLLRAACASETPFLASEVLQKLWECRADQFERLYELSKHSAFCVLQPDPDQMLALSSPTSPSRLLFSRLRFNSPPVTSNISTYMKLACLWRPGLPSTQRQVIGLKVKAYLRKWSDLSCR